MELALVAITRSRTRSGTVSVYGDLVQLFPGPWHMHVYQLLWGDIVRRLLPRARQHSMLCFVLFCILVEWLKLKLRLQLGLQLELCHLGLRDRFVSAV